ncbi:MAG: AMP-binding protein [Candidatus Babeliaceae bacterium]
MKNENIKKRFEELYNSLLVDGKLPFAACLLERAARLWPQRVALQEDDKFITFEQLYQAACGVSTFLEQTGIKAGERVIFLYENSIDFYKIYYGIWQTGAVIVPLNIFLHEKELAYIIDHVQPQALVVFSGLKEKVAKVQANVPLFTEVELLSYRDQKNTYPLQQQDPQEMAVLLYTSGTTGLPKGVMLSSENILINVLQGVACFSITEQERVYAALPLFHAYMQNTCLWSTILVGACTIIIPKIERKALLRGLEKKPTFVLGIPALYGLFCLMKKACFEQVKYFICGGDALADKTRAYFELLYRRKLCNGYGLTETAPFLCVNLLDEQAPTSSIGYPLYGIEIAVRDEAGHDVERGTIGIIWVKGKNIMLGYYRDPKLTAAVLHHGWFNTADMGYIDETGALVLSGRESDLIKHKGMKIYPQEIENVLMLHPQVILAAVIGVQDGAEEIPIAFISTAEQNPQLAEQLEALCRKNIAAYKIPRHFIIHHQLPTTATGKVDKKLLKKAYNEKGPDYSFDFKS